MNQGGTEEREGECVDSLMLLDGMNEEIEFSLVIFTQSNIPAFCYASGIHTLTNTHNFMTVTKLTWNFWKNVI